MREDDAFRAATMYYLQDQTMDVIARTLGISRSTVSRLIKSAREDGMVRISLRPPSSTGSQLGHRLSATFGIKAHVVSVRESASEVHRLEQVAMVAAGLIAEWFGPDMVLGVAWGTTVAAISRHLKSSPSPGSVVVQLNGAANTYASGVTYASDLIAAIAAAFDSTMYHFPVPAFFDFPETKRMMWRERSVRRVLQMQQRVDVALFGVGALSAEVPSHVYSSGYLDDAEIASLAADRVVGDVCTVFLREDGSFRDIDINARATGPSPLELRSIKRRVCVVVGEAKAHALLGALRARVVTDLVTDETTARHVLGLLRGAPGTADGGRLVP
ncbi:sugar-binding transcriptional regulator [Occultella kanbiaonis]|uniref:sugar-binding transcriptional regulator n=1 Tax=Occultella kanbiaonis TaxID=2675754 RepID=UPI0013D16936|nr:sugar-binding domain-containing protein [Occultella kanbiaonis]